MQQLSTRVIEARLNATVTGSAFVDPLSDSERSELSKLDPDYARRAQVYAQLFHSRQVEQATRLNDTEADNDRLVLAINDLQMLGLCAASKRLRGTVEKRCFG